ncbi:MAG: HAD family phosphatase [Eubacteriales bacterium]|nr:HAD family phosphatase [Eubacteriales bacterium]
MRIDTSAVRALLFDLDGTLVDSMWVWGAIDIEYLARFGLTAPEDLQEEIGGCSFQETAVYFKERFHIPDSLEKICADWTQMAWDKYTREVPLKSGVRELLAWCRENGIPCAIATSNFRELTEQVLLSHGIEDCFAAVVTGKEVAKGKPMPDIYLEAARRVGVSAGQCLVFEDIISGIQAGKAAGMKVCAVRDGDDPQREKEKRALADFYLSDYREIENIR